ncbi:hypothetical protein [Paenibacillus sp. Y412MC10]|uniref:hypothetical protein n=1 Tax=Geobacillus sp. (strain Y412MC10) TaxID=481743 RepID=UPI0011AB4916|nr:hypothetical protein [Paenibacillus sp. Y412MC10]
MKKIKKATFSLALAALMSLSCVSAYADPADTNDVSQNSLQQESNQESNGASLAVPLAAKVAYSFQNLYSTDTTIYSGYFTISSTQDVKLTLVQYPSKNGGGTADVRYSLEGSGRPAIEVNHNYTSTNTTITWYSVPAGTYRIGIKNVGLPDVDGNGYVN